MTPPPADTIVAIASPPGRGAVGIVRISGASVPRVCAAFLKEVPAPRRAVLTHFLDAGGGTIDQGLAVYFPAPASFTGEHVLELQGHGGVLVLDLVVRRALELGCRLARPGEFSERAYLNGKMDVAQAEAVADLIDAGTSAAARAAVRSLQGEFSARVSAIKDDLTRLRTYVEAAIDFPDEEVDFLSDATLSSRLHTLFEGFDALLSAARQGSLLREGLTVVIAGKPNAGKSSLMNRLVGEEVAIVTDLPGTTRDVLRRHLHLDGLPLHLVDTAGLRVAQDRVEEEGIRRARTEMRRADRVLYVVDAVTQPSGAHTAELGELPPGVPVTVVVNKMDLLGGFAAPVGTTERFTLWVSALTGEGMAALRTHLQASVGYQAGDTGALSARRRHLDALQRALAQVHAAADALRDSRAYELFAEDLRLAQRALSEITGEYTSEDLLGAIFASFCIGK